MANFDSETTLDSRRYLVSLSNPKFESACRIMLRTSDSGHWNLLWEAGIIEHNTTVSHIDSAL